MELMELSLELAKLLPARSDAGLLMAQYAVIHEALLARRGAELAWKQERRPK